MRLSAAVATTRLHYIVFIVTTVGLYYSAFVLASQSYFNQPVINAIYAFAHENLNALSMQSAYII
jgi:hypothetical protein